MAFFRIHTVAMTTASDGSLTTYTNEVNGLIHGIRYVKTDFADGSTMTVTVEDTGEAVWAESNVNASASRYPRVATSDTVGAASLYAAGGEPVEDKIAVANSRLKIVVASGGNAKTGTLHFIVG